MDSATAQRLADGHGSRGGRVRPVERRGGPVELHVDHGDRALREFAQVMRSTFRTTDVLARLGGDEFAVFLYDITSDQIGLVRHRLEAALATWNATPGVKLQLAASVGVALATETTASLDELVQTADTLMYDVKRSRAERR